jgi:translocator protein
MWDQIQWLGLFALTAFVLFQFSSSSSSSMPSKQTELAWVAVKRSQKENTKGCGTPPNWLFSVVWTVLYTLLIVATYMVWNDPEKYLQWQYDTILALIYGNLILNKLWSTLFFQYAFFLPALIDAILMFGSAAVITGLLISTKSWIEFSFFLVYTLWLCVAIVYNGVIISHHNAGKKTSSSYSYQ